MEYEQTEIETEEELDIESEDNEQAETMRLIEALAASILQKRDCAVEFRAASGVEKRWREDMEAFDSLDTAWSRTRMIDYATGLAPSPVDTGPKRSRVEVNIIRAKCETAEARFAEILLPVDDKNWGLKVTPIPDIMKGLKDDRQAQSIQTGQPLTKQDQSPVTIADVAKKDKDRAKEKMKAMETVIDDQLNECSYNGEQRKAIQYAVRLGTGIMKGPNVVRIMKKAYVEKDGEPIFELKEEHLPSSEAMNPWHVYPDPDVEDDISRAAYIWERGDILPRELRDLVGLEGYITSQIQEVLKEEPKRLKVSYEEEASKYRAQQESKTKGDTYEKWCYYGDLSRDDIEALNIQTEGEGIAFDEDDNMESYSVCIVFVNDRPIKVCLNTLDTGDLPYDFFQWTDVAGSPWGIGIPRQLMWLQRINNGAWRAMMDNAGDSSGANVIIGTGVQPADGKWELTGKKIWWPDDDVEDLDASKAFSQFQVKNNQAELQAIIKLVERQVDIEIGIPTLFKDEEEKAPETFGATKIKVDYSNVAFRGRIKLYDDKFTRPHLTRFYHWNMQYSDDPEIKGDFSVDPRGVSVLMEKDEQAKVVMQLFALKQDPDVAIKTDWDKAIDKLYTSMRLGDLLKSEEDVKRAKEAQAKKAPQQDPRLEAAKIRADVDLQKIQMTQQADAMDAQNDMAKTQTEWQLDAEEAERGRQHDRYMQESELKIQMIKLAQEKGLTLADIKKTLSIEAMKLKTQVALTTQEGKSPGDISTPVVEPVGRAEDGKSYIQ